MADEQKCNRCGMDMSMGSKPQEVNGHHYCCDGCRNDTGCTC